MLRILTRKFWLAMLLRRRFSSAFASRLVATFPDRHRVLIAEFQTSYRALDQSHRAELPDDVQRTMCLLVLASHTLLSREIPDKAVVRALIQDSLVEPARRSVRLILGVRFGLWPWNRRAGFERMRSFKPGGERFWGNGFVFEQEVDDGERNFVNVRKCLFHAFFTSRGIPEVTQVLCPLDDVWGDELNGHSEQYGVRYQRPETLARGGSACRFQLIRVRPPASSSS